jgi:hypothetical protein
MRLALGSRNKAPANGGEGGYGDGEEGSSIFSNFHARPGQPVVGRAKYGPGAGARENGSPNYCKRCEVWISLRQIYALPALSLIGRAENAIISSGEEIIAMAEESFN